MGLYRRLHRTSAELGAAIPGPRKPCVDALAYHAALKHSEDAAHLKLSPAAWRSIKRLLVQVEVVAERPQFGQKAHEILQAAAEAMLTLRAVASLIIRSNSGRW